MKMEMLEEGASPTSPPSSPLLSDPTTSDGIDSRCSPEPPGTISTASSELDESYDDPSAENVSGGEIDHVAVDRVPSYNKHIKECIHPSVC